MSRGRFARVRGLVIAAALAVAAPAAAKPAPRNMARSSFDVSTQTVTEIHFGGRKPRVGRSVTVVPTFKAPAVDVKIVKVRRLAHYEENVVWGVELEPIAHPAYAAIKQSYPEVVVLYPASPGATFMDAAAIHKSGSRLPRGFGRANVEWGVDVDSDGKPDALRLRYCTEDRKRVECFEATGHKIFRRAGRRWRQVYDWKPES